MKGWRIDGVALRHLREESQTTPRDFAALVGCHQHHYHKLERDQQPSTRLTWSILNVLTELLARKVRLSDIAEPTEFPRALREDVAS